MIYRPQFVFSKTAEPCYDAYTEFSFDYSNVNVLASNIASTWNINNRIPLLLDRDAPFFLRAVMISPTQLFVGLLDPFNNPLVDSGQNEGGNPGTLPAQIWGASAGYGWIAQDGGDEGEGIYCPPGSRFSLYLANITGSPLAAPVITLAGVKRYRKGVC